MSSSAFGLGWQGGGGCCAPRFVAKVASASKASKNAPLTMRGPFFDASCFRLVDIPMVSFCRVCCWSLRGVRAWASVKHDPMAPGRAFLRSFAANAGEELDGHAEHGCPYDDHTVSKRHGLILRYCPGRTRATRVCL